MAKYTTHICSKCRTQGTTNTDTLPDDWLQLTHKSPHNHNTYDFHLCSVKCLKAHVDNWGNRNATTTPIQIDTTDD